MTLREALASIPDPRGRNRQFPLSGLLALIPVAPLCRVDSLRGVSRFARAHPHLLPLLGLRRARGHYAFTTLLHRLDPQALREALARAFPAVSLPPGEREVWVVDGKVLRGSRKGSFPQVRLVEVLAMGLRPILAQAKAEGRAVHLGCRGPKGAEDLTELRGVIAVHLGAGGPKEERLQY